MPWQPWVRGWLGSVSTRHASGKSKVYGVLISNPDGYLTSQSFQLNTLLLLPCLPQTGLQPQARELCVLSTEATTLTYSASGRASPFWQGLLSSTAPQTLTTPTKLQ